MEEKVIPVSNGPLISDGNSKEPKEASEKVSANPFSRTTNSGSGITNLLQSCETEKQLIILVSRKPALYDSRHPRFHDDSHKEQLWQKIARSLATDLTNCLVAWSELRYRFQRHVRRLRAFHGSATKRDRKRERPCMRHEEELFFLYPHVARFPLIVEKTDPIEIAIPESIEGNAATAEVEFVEPPPVDVIDVDLEEDSNYKFRCSKEHRRLIEAVQAYPQLYDSQIPGYDNTRHRGLIWGAISNELHDKATKLMKSWLKLQTRYEWELNKGPTLCKTSELCQLMDFLRPHVQRLPGTVCKSSKYLEADWHEPIEHFRSVMALINTMRSMPDLVQLTDESLSFTVKPPRYDEFWQKVGNEVMCGYERCEVTWLVLRSFHQELQAMRLAGYQLQDKWYFENAISSIFKQVATRSTSRQAVKRKHNGAVVPSEPPAKIQPPPRLPLAIVYPPKCSSSGSSTSSSGTSTGTFSGKGIVPTIMNVRSCSGPANVSPNSPSASTSSILNPVPDSAIPSFVIPKITSAISVASLNTSPMRIPATLRIAPAVVQPPVVMNTPPAGSNPALSAVRPVIPQRPGLQVTIKSNKSTPSPAQMPPAVSRSLIRAVHPSNHSLSSPNAAAVASLRYPQPTPLGALAEKPNPQPVLPPSTAKSIPNSIPVNPQNTVINNTSSSGSGPPMVRIHQPGLNSSWDVTNNGTPASKPLGSQAATTKPTEEAAKSVKAAATIVAAKKPIAAPSTPDNVKKYRNIAPAPPPGITKVAKPAIESVPEPSTAPVATKDTALAAAPSVKAATLATTTKQITPATKPNAASLAKSPTAAITNADGKSDKTPTKAPSSATVSTSPTVSNAKTVANAETGTEASTSGDSQLEVSSKTVTVFMKNYPATGNIIHILIGNSSNRLNLNMTRAATLIREVMAIPQLHKKDLQSTPKFEEFWKNLSKRFHMPEEALRASWKFLKENISVFPTIAPMPELMRSVKTSGKVWEKSHRLFSKFDEIARKYMWMDHKDVLPEVIRHFRKYEYLYWELRKPRPGEKPIPPRHFTDRERQEVWLEARVKFPNLNHRDIWSMFKFAFRTYMEDLERGIENPWPQNWWQALEQLKFLADVRYHPLEPYYYIVHNKIYEEVKRCSMYEALMSADPSDKSKPTPTSLLARLSKEPKPWETEDAKRLLTGKLTKEECTFTITRTVPPTSTASPPTPVPETVPVTPAKVPAAESTSGKKTRSKRPQGLEGSSKQVTKKSEPPKNQKFNKLPTIEAFELTHVLRRHPNTFEKSSTIDKRTAWVRVSKELNATVTECRLGLQYALRQMRILKITDPTNRCTMGHKYFRHMTEIYKQVKPNGQITVRTPQQVNQSLAEPAEEVKPNNFIPEINVTKCSPNLVVKNWASAVGSFSKTGQDDLCEKLKQVFAKYAKEPNANVTEDPAPP
ncbi:uncharacterized protein LOC108110119 [Drosophila eugracilis]|uniref:uncharacterized protein LOC108110119 n=1 Tax=Drosophila eugracilis TaxID=29029 RepID=UPI0007E5D753|nr:uncharacterized protein LOC108110119 [Drosophila eugracilis]